MASNVWPHPLDPEPTKGELRFAYAFAAASLPMQLWGIYCFVVQLWGMGRSAATVLLGS